MECRNRARPRAAGVIPVILFRGRPTSYNSPTREGGSKVAKLSWLLCAVLVFVAKPALAENFTYRQYSASSEGWKRGFVFAVAQHQTTINLGEGPPYSTARAFQRCLSGASDDMLEQQVETYVARNLSSVTEPMVVVYKDTSRPVSLRN